MPDGAERIRRVERGGYRLQIFGIRARRARQKGVALVLPIVHAVYHVFERQVFDKRVRFRHVSRVEPHLQADYKRSNRDCRRAPCSTRGSIRRNLFACSPANARRPHGRL